MKNNFSINIISEYGPIRLQWIDTEFFKRYSISQNPQKFLGSYSLSDQEFSNSLKWWNFEWRKLVATKVFDLDNNSTIIDVGSGIGIISLILQQYLQLQEKQSIHYLVDRQQGNKVELDFASGEHYGFFNHWEPFKNALSSTVLDPDKFKILDPKDQWPTNVDLIFSRRSWCYHYPYSTYRNNVIQTLKPGGKLFVDVFRDVDALETISKDMNSEPIYRLDWKSTSSITGTIRNISTCLWKNCS